MNKLIPTLALCVVSVAARADIVTSLATPPTATGDGYFAYTYNVQLTGGQLDPTNSAGTPVQFGTVYDFGPLAGANGTPYMAKSGLLNSVFAFSFDGTNVPASTSNTSTTLSDEPGLTNIRFTYTGSNGVDVLGESTTLDALATTVLSGSANLGTFTVYSPFSAIKSGGTYDGQTYKGTNDTLQANFGQLSVPQVTTATTPEPSSLALLGTGLLSVAGVLRRKLQQS